MAVQTPQSINRDAKKLDWFASPESQNLKVGDFILITGQPDAYIGAVAEPYGDKLFPSIKLTYGEPCNRFYIAHWIYPAQGEICDVSIHSEVDFTKVRSVRQYNRARQINMEDDDWLENRGLTIIAQIKDFEYTLYNTKVWTIRVAGKLSFQRSMYFSASFAQSLEP